MTSLIPSFSGALEARQQEQQRLSSPSAGRNKAVIAQALADHLPEGARLLEIASGTGEHALASVTLRRDLSWTPSDPNPDSRLSADAWAIEAAGRIRPCLDLDVTRTGWAADLGVFDALFCANMIHIAPWQAAEGLFDGARQALKPGGQMHLYGPFKEGDDTAPSNLQFDADLKRRDPRWGVRALQDVDRLARSHGFKRLDRREMPTNNLLVSWGLSA
jgi:SAM-dependent methyltransferase